MPQARRDFSLPFMSLSAVFHTASLQEQMAALSDTFAIEGEFLHCPHYSGHINMTFRAV